MLLLEQNDKSGRKESMLRPKVVIRARFINQDHMTHSYCTRINPKSSIRHYGTYLVLK